jgi:hypothetical protein
MAHFTKLTEGIPFGSSAAPVAAAEGRAAALDLDHLPDDVALAELDRRYLANWGTEAHRYARARLALAEAEAEVRGAALAYRYAADRIRARGPSHPPNAAQRAERAAAERAAAERAAAERAAAERAAAKRDPLRPASADDKAVGFNMAEVNRRIWQALAKAKVITSAAAEWATVSGLDPANDDHQRKAKEHKG